MPRVQQIHNPSPADLEKFFEEEKQPVASPSKEDVAREKILSGVKDLQETKQLSAEESKKIVDIVFGHLT